MNQEKSEALQEKGYNGGMGSQGTKVLSLESGLGLFRSERERG